MSSGITEDEAALYDRQIRLWGVEAQNKMRTSSVLVYNLRGISVEIIKNLVLAGIGKLTILDQQPVNVRDLGSNYFVSENDVNKLRVEAAVDRIRALNPRVKVETCIDETMLDSEEFLSQFDLIVITEVDAPTLLRVNTLTRKLGKKLFAATSIGMDGWIFVDLLDHEYMADQVKTTGGGETVTTPTKFDIAYTSFENALTQKWVGVKGRAMKRISKTLWAVLTLFSHQLTNDTPPTTTDLITLSKTFLPTLSVDPTLLTEAHLSQISRTIGLEFPPTTAILGGLVGQDILNALGGKQKPIHNFLIFEGSTGAGDVISLGL